MSAILSKCRTYRYRLSRYVSDGPKSVGFIMLNPSTADENFDDPTIRKCLKYSKRWGFDQMHVANLFAYRATDPKEITKVPDPIGPDNYYHLEQVAKECEMVICAWGQKGTLFGQAARVLEILPAKKLHALRVSTQPWHPLYLPDALDPQPWRPK